MIDLESADNLDLSDCSTNEYEMELEDIDDEQPRQQPVHLEKFSQVDGIYFLGAYIRFDQ